MTLGKHPLEHTQKVHSLSPGFLLEISSTLTLLLPLRTTQISSELSPLSVLTTLRNSSCITQTLPWLNLSAMAFKWVSGPLLTQKTLRANPLELLTAIQVHQTSTLNPSPSCNSRETRNCYSTNIPSPLGHPSCWV